LEEFRQWRDQYVRRIESIYDYFRAPNRSKSREYEFSDNRREWIRTSTKYVTNIGHFEHMQNEAEAEPEPGLEAVINARNVQDGDMLMIGGKTIDAVIKLLEVVEMKPYSVDWWWVQFEIAALHSVTLGLESERLRYRTLADWIRKRITLKILEAKCEHLCCACGKVAYRFCYVPFLFTNLI
jgi:hypothetical protein